MNIYEKQFNNALNSFCDTGFWFENRDVKVGFSYAEVTIYHENEITIESDCETEFDGITVGGWEEFFEKFPEVKIVFSLDCALKGNFVTWGEFLDICEGKMKREIIVL